MRKWLTGYAYKTDMSWWIFATAVTMTIIVSIFTVSWQSWLAATGNPVEVLRYE